MFEDWFSIVAGSLYYAFLLLLPLPLRVRSFFFPVCCIAIHRHPGFVYITSATIILMIIAMGKKEGGGRRVGMTPDTLVLFVISNRFITAYSMASRQCCFVLQNLAFYDTNFVSFVLWPWRLSPLLSRIISHTNYSIGLHCVRLFNCDICKSNLSESHPVLNDLELHASWWLRNLLLFLHDRIVWIFKYTHVCIYTM